MSYTNYMWCQRLSFPCRCDTLILFRISLHQLKLKTKRGNNANDNDSKTERREKILNLQPYHSMGRKKTNKSKSQNGREQEENNARTTIHKYKGKECWRHWMVLKQETHRQIEYPPASVWIPLMFTSVVNTNSFTRSVSQSIAYRKWANSEEITDTYIFFHSLSFFLCIAKAIVRYAFTNFVHCIFVLCQVAVHRA